MATMGKERSNSVDDSCDLGLGRGLKPGALSFDSSADTFSSFTKNISPTHFVMLQDKTGISDSGDKSDKSLDNIPGSGKMTSKLSDKWKWLKSENKNNTNNPHKPSNFVNSEMEKLSRSGTNHHADTVTASGLPASQCTASEVDACGDVALEATKSIDLPNGTKSELYKPMNQAVIDKKLQQAHEEVRALKGNLELCQMQLDAKLRAITILQGHASAVQKEQTQSNTKTKLRNQTLLDEVNRLQFELDHNQSSMITSQQTWSERFDRVCVENKALMVTLEARSSEMRKVHAENMSIIRERDELLALLDIQERQRFESQRNEDGDSTEYSITELAVLGACRCQVDGPEPCGCAFAAAGLKKNIANINLKLEEQKVKQQETSIMTDAYRIAFEEQLARNRGLIRKITELSNAPGLGRSEKAKAAIKWLVKQFNEEDHRPTNSPLTDIDRSELPCDGLFLDVPEDTGYHGSLNEKTEQDLIDILVDMVCDKSEALAHQRLTARILANRNKDLEARLSNYEDTDHSLLQSSPSS